MSGTGWPPRGRTARWPALTVGSWLGRHVLELAWAVFAALNVAVIFRVSKWETTPFHFLWVSLAVLYGYRVWDHRTTAAVIGVVVVVTGVALSWSVARTGQDWDELAEVPLMAAMFVAMAWHAHRHRAGMEEVRRLAEAEHRLVERQREFIRDASHELKTPDHGGPGPRRADPGGGGGDGHGLRRRGDPRRAGPAGPDLGAPPHPARRPPPRVPPAGDGGRGGAGRGHGQAVERHGPPPVGVPAGRAGDGPQGCRAAPRGPGRPGGERREFTGGRGCRATGDEAVVEVEDSGEGIAPDQQGRVFEAFARADGARSRSSGGTGLGLAIVRAIVEAHGGAVGVESEPGRGSRFWMRLPGFRPRGPGTGGPGEADVAALRARARAR